MIWTIVGIAATSMTTFGFVPQIVKMQKTQSPRREVKKEMVNDDVVNPA